jgi:hypothetical protein
MMPLHQKLESFKICVMSERYIEKNLEGRGDLSQVISLKVNSGTV